MLILWLSCLHEYDNSMYLLLLGMPPIENHHGRRSPSVVLQIVWCMGIQKFNGSANNNIIKSLDNHLKSVMNSTCIHYGGTTPKYVQRTGVTKYAPNPLYNGETTNIHIHLTKSLGGGVDGPSKLGEICTYS
jgi:hypothetical protein